MVDAASAGELFELAVEAVEGRLVFLESLSCAEGMVGV